MGLSVCPRKYPVSLLSRSITEKSCQHTEWWYSSQI
jgi:hypothetical protein